MLRYVNYSQAWWLKVNYLGLLVMDLFYELTHHTCYTHVLSAHLLCSAATTAVRVKLMAIKCGILIQPSPLYTVIAFMEHVY